LDLRKKLRLFVLMENFIYQKTVFSKKSFRFF
jgi:hypothetical protein